jgi:hypothetical protein
MRKRSGGTVEQLPSGRYRARRKTDGKYRSIGTFATEEEARLALQQPAKAPQGALLLATFGEEWLKRRRGEISDYRNDEQRWRLYIEQRIGQLPLRKIRRADVKDWLRELRQLGLATQTRKNARTVLSQCLEDAVDRELIETNPVRGIRFKRREEARTHEPWTILYPDEQLALLEAVPSDEWHTVAQVCRRSYHRTLRVMPAALTHLCHRRRGGHAGRRRCPKCAGLSHRVRGKKCSVCGARYQPETPVAVQDCRRSNWREL